MVGKRTASVGLAARRISRQGRLARAALVALLAGSSAAGATVSSELDLLIERFRRAEAEFSAGLQRAADQRERAAVLETSPWRTFLPRFEELAEHSPDLDERTRARIWTLELALAASKPAQAYAALDVLEREGLASAALVDLPRELAEADWLFGAPRCEATLRRVAVGTQHERVRSAAVFALCERLAGSVPTEVDAVFPRAKEGRTEEARVLLRRSVERGPSEWYERARGLLFELEHLQIGMTAPDVEAIDQRGERFRLSEYHGKVVVLDFWGTWCTPCVDKLPSLAALAERCAAQSFALLGVLADGPTERARFALAELGVTWRNAIDGGTSGPWASTWNVRGWPTTYVLDTQGVIRFKDLHGEHLESAVQALLSQ